ncbi:MAG TPA: NnrU family protein [Rhizomicrobium sp.]|jgi:uncharacterized membrane protein
MNSLIWASAVFLAIHLLISGTRLRDVLTGVIGERAYLGLFSLASLGVIVWLARAYDMAQASGDDPMLYDLGIGVHHLAIPVVALAFFLGVQGLLMPNPTAVMQEGAASRPDVIRGVLRITRHPFLWGVALWSAFHLAANGDEASIILFGTFFVLSLLGTLSIDAKRRRKLGPAWENFAAKTSNLPFAAVLAGRTRLMLAESFGWRFWVTAFVFLIVLFGHARVFGVSPFPTGWVPF